MRATSIELGSGGSATSEVTAKNAQRAATETARADRGGGHPGRTSRRHGRVSFVFDRHSTSWGMPNSSRASMCSAIRSGELSAPPRVLVKLPQIRFDFGATAVAARRVHLHGVEPRPYPDERDRAVEQRAHAGARRRRGRRAARCFRAPRLGRRPLRRARSACKGAVRADSRARAPPDLPSGFRPAPFFPAGRARGTACRTR